MSDLEKDNSPTSRTVTAENAPQAVQTVPQDHSYIGGWRFIVILVLLLVCLFIVQMDSSITSTAIVTISDDLGQYDKSPWVLSAYMLTYGALQILWAKLSDTYTRKTTFLIALAFFTGFSGACAASNTMVQLIIFRACQGIGGCGVYALVQVIFFEILPPKDWPKYAGLFTGAIALSYILGPLVGGAISLQGAWRWIFLLNVPICVVALVGTTFVFPRTLWTEPSAAEGRNPNPVARSVWHLDILGSILLLGTCLLPSTGFQQAALGYRWTSSAVLPFLLCSLPFAIGFLMWERFLTLKREYPVPVLPWRVFQSRQWLGMLLNTMFSGAILTIGLFQIPQRFMNTNGLSAFDAAVRLLPFGTFVPGGSFLVAILTGRVKMRPSILILTGAILQLIGSALLSHIPSDTSIHPSQYGFHILIGTGIGLVQTSLLLLVPYVVNKADLAVGTSSMSQFRILGGLFGVGIATSISTLYLKRHLPGVLPANAVSDILDKTENLQHLTQSIRERAQVIFAESYRLQIFIAIGLAAAQIPATLLMWTNQKIGVEG
ncbi:MFS general substrate transporter [Lophiostoma macrostomum CBS 122681]|uniref:MFS general substrate transporter n=1 Tax=Lophiostoma macrostomum CBS 122681 TaxID=1314788 RepID=A0A6A6SR98_9PLEO|nr:MFS general substrate transporter [Lophiostoma macrostomum CBS 122681]